MILLPDAAWVSMYSTIDVEAPAVSARSSPSNWKQLPAPLVRTRSGSTRRSGVVRSSAAYIHTPVLDMASDRATERGEPPSVEMSLMQTLADCPGKTSTGPITDAETRVSASDLPA